MSLYHTDIHDLVGIFLGSDFNPTYKVDQDFGSKIGSKIVSKIDTRAKAPPMSC